MAGISALPGSPAYYTYPNVLLEQASKALADSANRLSSGNRIVQISDDVAAASVAAGLDSQITGLKQSSSNLALGSSLLEVAQGGLGEINSLLDKLQFFAVQSQGGVTYQQKQFLQQQFIQTLGQIDKIATTTSFNHINLLDGTLANGTTIVLGKGNNGENLGSVRLAIPNTRKAALFNGTTPDITTGPGAIAAENSINAARTILQTTVSGVTGNQNSFDFAAQSIQRSITGVQEAHSALVDTDIVAESTNFATAKLRVNSTVAVIAQLRLLQPHLLALLNNK